MTEFVWPLKDAEADWQVLRPYPEDDKAADRVFFAVAKAHQDHKDLRRRHIHQSRANKPYNRGPWNKGRRGHCRCAAVRRFHFALV